MLLWRARVRESVEMTMQHFLHGLKFTIKGIVRHHRYNNMNELCIMQGRQNHSLLKRHRPRHGLHLLIISLVGCHPHLQRRPWRVLPAAPLLLSPSSPPVRLLQRNQLLLLLALVLICLQLETEIWHVTHVVGRVTSSANVPIIKP